MDRKRCPVAATKRRRRGRASASSVSILESMFAPNTTDDVTAVAPTSENALATSRRSSTVKKGRNRLLVEAGIVASSRNSIAAIALPKGDREKNDESSSYSYSVESSVDGAEDLPTSNKKRKPACANTANAAASDNDSSSNDEDADPEQMMKDWEVYDDLTSKERKQIAVSHGFATIGDFRKCMTLQQLAFTRSFKNVDASELKFAWQTWTLNSTLEKKQIADDHGYASISKFEDFISIQQAQAVTLMEPDPDPASTC